MEKCAEDDSRTRGHEDHSNRQVKNIDLCVGNAIGLEFSTKTQ